MDLNASPDDLPEKLIGFQSKSSFLRLLIYTNQLIRHRLSY
jgi:hypothetical protein